MAERPGLDATAGLSAREFIASLAAEFHEFPEPATDKSKVVGNGADGPLDWPGYGDQRERARERTGERESVLCGKIRVHDPGGSAWAVVIAFEFGFLGGSIGQVAGDRVVDAFQHARASRLPVVSVISSGGSRMQEGMRALHQLQRVAEQCLLLRRERLPHLALLRGPVTGGMWASLAAGADVIYAVPTSSVCFAGARVRAASASGEGVADREDPTAFTAEAKFDHGQVDRLVDPAEVPAAVAAAVRLLDASPGRGDGSDPAEVPAAMGGSGTPESGWQAVSRTRDPARPRAGTYLDAYFDERLQLSGDRCGGADPGMLCGLGRRAGRVVAYAAQTGTANTPAGFRTASRLVRLADHLGVPVLTLVDTPGAEHGAAAERAGVGPAIAELFADVAGARVPITTLVIGEGGSGGALALASPERTWITPDGYFSVIAPESSAAILKRDSSEVPRLADQLRLRPQDLVDLGVVRGVAPRN